MIRFDGRFVRMAIIGSALAGCQTLPPPAPAVDVHAAMVGRIDPAAVVVWSVGSRAMSEASGSRQARMDEASWTRLEAASQQLASYAGQLADARTIRVGAHNDKLEGFVDGAEIQARIDAEPDEFRRLAYEMASHAGNLTAAAKRKDIPQSQALIKSLYDNCRACHSRYWETQAP